MKWLNAVIAVGVLVVLGASVLAQEQHAHGLAPTGGPVLKCKTAHITSDHEHKLTIVGDGFTLELVETSYPYSVFSTSSETVKQEHLAGHGEGVFRMTLTGHAQFAMGDLSHRDIQVLADEIVLDRYKPNPPDPADEPVKR